jgi:hypothetical protein
MKLLAKEDKNLRKYQKEIKKWINIVRCSFDSQINYLSVHIAYNRK